MFVTVLGSEKNTNIQNPCLSGTYDLLRKLLTGMFKEVKESIMK